MKRLILMGFLALLLTGCSHVVKVLDRPDKYLFQPDAPPTVVDGVCEAVVGSVTIRYTALNIRPLIDKETALEDICRVLTPNNFYRAYYDSATNESINARRIELIARGGTKGNPMPNGDS